jgi:TRAP transporter TAXI family solute receptor
MKDFLKIYVPIAILVAAGFALAYRFIDPAPPSHLRIAAGALGGGYDQYAENLKAALARDGITLDVLPTAGSLQNLTLLDAPRSGVDLALVQGGTGNREAMPALRSIASLYYEPIWLFVRGAPPDHLSALKGKRIAMGADGSGTRQVAAELLAISGVDNGNAVFIALGGKDAAAALKAGRIDAVFLVTSLRDPTVSDLGLSPGIGLVNLAQAQAYTRTFRFLSVVSLPKGMINLEKNVPAQDVNLLAPAAALVSRESLHPALVDLLIAATRSLSGSGDEFAEPEEFPSAKHLDFPQTSEAKRALANGPNFLRRYLPFWAAVLVQRMWILVVPLLTLMIPLLRMAPPTYRWQVHRRIHRHYKELKQIEASARDIRRPEARELALKALDRLQAEAGRLQIPNAFAEDLYHLREHIEFVKQTL